MPIEKRPSLKETVEKFRGELVINSPSYEDLREAVKEHVLPPQIADYLKERLITVNNNKR